MHFLRTITVIVPAAAALTAPASASALALEQVGSFDRPTYVTSDPGDPNRLFVVEQAGRIQLTEGGDTTPFLNIDALVHDLNPRGDYGLFSMAFSPDYATNNLFYVAYTSVDDPSTVGEDESGDWHIDEFSADGDTADPNSRREVLTIKFPPSQFHYGGQLQFGPDGYLYASTGDGGPQEDPDGNAQNLQGLLGKILRINPTGSSDGDYTVPADNPFTDTASCSDGCDEIWSYGLRHPWRFSFDRLTGDLVIGDVGHQLWEEVDFDTGPAPGKGDNFGWNCREGAHQGPVETSSVCTERAGTFTEPVFEYPHADPGPCSITGGYVVRDGNLGALYGRYLYADFCVGELRSVNLGPPTASGDQSEELSVPLVTSFGEDADCRMYVASFDGPVYRLTEPAAGAVGCEPPETSIDSGPANGATTNENTVDTSSSSEPTPAPDGEPGPGESGEPGRPGAPAPGPLTLDLGAKKQELKKKLKFFATATADSTLVVTGKTMKKTTKQLAANETTKVKAKLKRAKRKRLEEKLDVKGKAKTKVEATATDQSGATATDKVQVKLKD